MFSESIEGTHATILAATALRNKEAIFYLTSILWSLWHSHIVMPTT